MFALRSRRSNPRRSTHIDLNGTSVLDAPRRWYGAVVAVLIAGALVVGGLTPASAAEALPPEVTQPADPAAGAEPIAADAAAPTPTPDPAAAPALEAPAPVAPVTEEPAPEPPATEEPAPEPPVTEEPAPVAPVTEEPAPEPPASEEPAPVVTEETTPTPAATESATPEPEATESATPTPTTTPTPPAAARLLLAGSALTNCGSSSSCGRLEVDVVVIGGSATASNWTLKATNTADQNFYTLQRGTTMGVSRPATYALSATPVNAALATGYRTDLTCDVGDNVTFDQAAGSVAYSSSTSNRNRTAECVFTISSEASATIKTYVAGDRTGSAGQTPLGGATLELWAGDSTGPSTPFTGAWAQCISLPGDGSCTFTVPSVNAPMIGSESQTTGGNKDRRFWVVQKSAPAGWTINTNLATGASGGTTTPYNARTGAVSSSEVQDSRINFMVDTGNTNDRASRGTFVMSRVNVPVPQACGVDVALVVDLSGSLGGQLDNVKSASKAMVSALEGTDSSVGVYTFSDSAPASAGGNKASTQVATAAGAQSVRNHIDGFTEPTGATNWDRGLSQVPTGTFDAVIVITDGNPTRYANGSGPGNYTRFAETENGVLSANMLKAGGTRVIALGVGSGISGPAANLAAISGPTVGSDYFQAATFTDAAAVIRDFALGDCLGSLTVVKQIVPKANVGDNVSGSTPGAGWTFNAASQTAGLTLGSTSGVTPADTGAVNFPLTYSAGTTAGTVRVSELQQNGFGIQTQGGKNAVCTATTLSGSTSSVPVTNQTVGGNPGFDVSVPRNASVSCVVYNKPQIVKTGITVDKTWRINGTDYSNANNPLASDGLKASLTLAGSAQNWATPRTGLDEGTAVAINETTTLPANFPGCVVGGVEVRNADGTVVSTTLPYSATLAANAATNTYTVTNVINCTSKLTLKKSVANGSAQPNAWTLTAFAPAGAVNGPTGTTGVSGAVTPGATYQLGEANGPATYAQVVSPGASIVAPATGTWACVQTKNDGTVIPGYADGLNGAVTVPAGANVTCTATNQTASLVLLKQVINDDGGAATASNFSLTATPATLTGLSASTVTGATSASSANTIGVRPNWVYTLSESNVAGYANVKLQKLVGSTWTDVVTNPSGYPKKDGAGNWQILVSPLATDTYRFVNDDVAPKLTLVKNVVNAYGSNAAADAWQLKAAAANGSGVTGTSGVSSTVTAGVTYTLSESGGPIGFEQTKLSCTQGSTSMSAPTITLAAGADVTCTFENSAKPGKLTLKKSVDNAGGGTAVATDWNGKLFAGATAFNHNVSQNINAGTYTLSEQQLNGYTQTDLSCVGNSVPVGAGSLLTIKNGDDVTCTFTNTAKAPRITLIKTLDLTWGGDADASDWTLTAAAGAADPKVQGATGVSGAAKAGVVYTLSEDDAVDGFELASLSCTDLPNVSAENPTFTLALGQETTCTFTNASQPGELKLTKSVDNATGGSAVASDWNQKLQATMDDTTISFDSGQTLQVTAGSYTLSELQDVAGYALSDLTCVDQSTSIADPTVVVSNGELAECTFTNKANAAKITLQKVVDTAEWGGSADASAWTLKATTENADHNVTGTTGVSAAAHAGVEYTLSEADGVAGYDLSALSCTGLPDVSVQAPTFTLAPGQETTCTFVNKSQPAQLVLNKAVDNSAGGTAVPTDWNGALQATLGDATLTFNHGEAQNVVAGTYTLSELQNVAGYDLTSLTCEGQESSLADPTVTVPNGALTSCEFTNTAKAGKITLIKQVDTEQWGGSADPAAWTLTAAAGAGAPTVTGKSGVTGAANAGVAYTLSEDNAVAGFALTSLSCTGLDDVTAANPTFTLGLGQETTCTFTNSSQPANLKLNKVVNAINGGDAEPEAWDGKLQTTLGDITDAYNHGETKNVAAGTYMLSELQDVAGYDLTGLSCGGQATNLADPTVTVTNGSFTSCDFINTGKSGKITLIKQVDTEQWGGSANPAEWTLSALAGEGDPKVVGSTGTSGAAKAGVVYTLSEDEAVAGFALSSLACTGLDDVSAENPTFSLGLGQETTCTFTNTSQPGSLQLNKVVDNTNGGTAVSTDWNGMLQAGLGDGAPAAFDHATPQLVGAGTYTLSELQNVAGYSLTDLSCVDQETTLADPTVTVSNGALTVCEFTNASVAPQITLIKKTESPFGEPADATRWELSATTPGGPNVSGTTGVTGAAKATTEYTLTETDAVDGYELTSLACTGIEGVSVENPVFTLNPGQVTECTFTNTEQPATLALVKSVDNTNGGSAVPSDWDGLLVAGLGDQTHAFNHGETKQLAPGTYSLDEAAGPAGYEWTDLSCYEGGYDRRVAPDETSMDDKTITLTAGESATCVFTNASEKPTLTLEKQVDNAGGGMATADQFTLSAANGDETVLTGTGAMISGDVASLSGNVPAEVDLALGEMGPSGYTAGEWACRDTASSEPVTMGEGGLRLDIGDDVTCRIVNTAIPSSGNVFKQVTSTTPNDDGTWTITYEIIVSNESEDSRYTYSLADTLNFGGDIDVQDAAWSLEGASENAFAADGTATLATDRTIDPLTQDVYTVTVTANVTAAAYAAGTDSCDVEGAEAGGFLNTATLTDRDGSSDSSACSAPYVPEVEKSTESVTSNGDGTYDLTYLLTVAAPDAPDGATVSYDLKETPALPVGVTPVDGYTATAVGSTPAPTNATYDGMGEWVLVDNGRVGHEPHVYRVAVTLQVAATAVTSEKACSTEENGIAVGNSATVISGGYEESSEVCDVVYYDDVSIEKTAALADGLTSVEPGDIFDYVLTVTNNGSRAATNVLVTDTDLNERLTVLGYSVTEGYTWAPVGGYEDNDVALKIDSIGVGEQVEIRVQVRFEAAEMPAIAPYSPVTPIPVPLEELDNEACVAADLDQNPDNNCDVVTVPTRDIAAIVYTSCVGDAPFLGWTVTKSATLRDEDITMTWTPDMPGTHDPANVTLTEAGGTASWSDEIEWPGAEFTPSGVSIDYPGWRVLQASDYAPDGGYYLPGTTTVMTAEQQAAMVFNGLILDDSELDYAWLLESTVKFSVNPELEFSRIYPAASPDCYVARHTELEIAKTASTDKVKQGSTLTYTIDIHNVSDDSAASNVVVTDEIPATLKVTDVTWAGKGDANVFPNWQTCEITDQDANGYGGLLTCTLFGPLQPTGAEGVHEAPTLTLAATVSTSAANGVITNVGVVDYSTFDDPTDTGRDTDDAVINVSVDGETPPPTQPTKPAKPALPATGAPFDGTWVILGLLGVIGGILLIRRRKESRAQV